MAVVSEWVTAQTSDGPMSVYIARPDDGVAYPGLVVIQEVFGVNDHIQDVTRRFAAEGFVAAAPEIYHRFETRTVPYSDVQAGLALRQRLSDDQVTEDVNVTVALLNSRTDVRSGQIGMVGYCYGGRVTYLLATRNPDIRAFVSYYGGRIVADDPSAPIHASANIRAPILLFFGEQDQSIPMEQVERIRETLTKLDKPHQIVTYPQAGHGFFCDARPANYNAEAAADSWVRALAFLRQHLS